MKSLFLNTSNSEENSFNNYENVGKWINKNTNINSSIGCIEVGTIGYFSNRKIIDFCGLVTPLTAKYLANNDTYSWILTYKPDYVFTHSPIWENMENVVNTDFFKKNYIIDERFPYDKFLLYKRKYSYWIN
ncbi:hypothetical protein ETU10_00685 [Apibacter muscae]|uniref:hypothetical protein n=1 Tax=Apibacter muscae TaxID=2509004 RepID=UPI0011AD7DFC|nr:hypothetical protein [Apibacter muscae]TWP25183.1 hypothetical protein ETU10_00685 [Apibacter muscae]